MSGYTQTAGRLAAHASSGALGSLFDRFVAWRDRRRGLETLAGLDERMLKDVGLTSADVSRELDRSFWRG